MVRLQLCLQCLRRVVACVSAGWILLLILGLIAYLVINTNAGTTSGEGSLKAKLRCCIGYHIALGYVGWAFPPFFVFCMVYQVLDHYGYWWGGSEEPWSMTLLDISEYWIGLAICYAARYTRP